MGKILKFPARHLAPTHQKNNGRQALILSFKLKPLKLNDRIKNDVNYFQTCITNRK